MNIGHKEKFQLKPGSKFNRLTVESFAGQKLTPQGRNEPFYNVICECGKRKQIRKETLVKGRSKSCGCLQRELMKGTSGRNTKEPGYASFYSYFYSYLKGAKNRNLEFNLSQDEFKNITQMNCYYCNKEPDHKHFNKKHQKNILPYISNGIDRINSDLGYIKDNIVACCLNCNIAKMGLTQIQFYDMINRIYNNRIKI